VTDAAVEALLAISLVLDAWLIRRVWLLSERVARLEGRRNGQG
jgi:hypothetical protein